MVWLAAGKPFADHHDVKRRLVADGQLVIPGGDRAVPLEPANAALHGVPVFVATRAKGGRAPRPGGIILGGTGAGTAADQSKRHPDGTPLNLDLFLKVGDVVEVKSPSIGSLTNHIVAK
jgi:2-keto-4-pentenoate hydratase/2-oxohepta-3-ene-1,7-dioic acid hydratase in catechol pathway